MVVDYNSEMARDVFSRISDQSKEDVLARLWSDDFWEQYKSIDQATNLYELRRIVVKNQTPMLLMGVDVVLPGVGQTWCISTKESYKSAFSLVKEAMKAQQILTSSGSFHRLFTLCNENDNKSMKWLTLLGYVKEGVMKGHSKQGGDYSMWRLQHG